MSVPSSPVSRLHSLISSLLKKDLNRAILIAVADEAGVANPGTNSESIKAYADFLELVDEAHLFAQSIPNPRPSYLKPIEKIKSIIESNNPYSSILSISQAFPTQDLDHLESIVCLVDDQVGAVEMSETQLNNLKEKILEIKEEVIRSDIDENLKKMLFEGISFLVDAIERHRLYGDTGIKKAFDAFFGEIKRRNRQYNGEEVYFQFAGRILQLEPWVITGRFADFFTLAGVVQNALGG
jgi:hypothetical protein